MGRIMKLTRRCQLSLRLFAAPTADADAATAFAAPAAAAAGWRARTRMRPFALKSECAHTHTYVYEQLFFINIYYRHAITYVYRFQYYR